MQPLDTIAAEPAEDLPTATERRTQRLLAAYAETLDLIDRLGPAPTVATGRRKIAPIIRPIGLPRPRWMLRTLTVRHITGVLASLERRYHREAALGRQSATMSADAKAVASFRASLAPASWRLRMTALVLATLVLARLLGELLPQRVELLPWLPGQENVTRLFNSIFGTFEPSSSSLSAAFDDIIRASPAELAAFAFLLAAAAYVVTRPLMSGFRLKRLLLNLHPDAEHALRDVPASWSVSRSVGVYELEREALGAFGGRPPREVPYDLIVALLFALGVVSFYLAASASDIEDFGLAFIIAVSLIAYVAPGAVRIAWLIAVWRARWGRGRAGSLLSEEIEVSWRSETVRQRSPLLIGFAGLGIFYFVPVWWWCAMKDLRDFGRAHDVPELEQMNPAVEALLMAGWMFMVPPLITLLQAPSRVRAAQVAAGLERPLNPRIIWLALVLPLLCGAIQRELNRLWDVTAAPAARADG